MNPEAIDDVNDRHKTDECPEEHERGGGHQARLQGFARPLFNPDHDGDQHHAECQAAVSEGHFNDILLHLQDFGV